jgi:peptidoglycan/xylan/chitin deacetylase (PgdA/CDA1 family)
VSPRALGILGATVALCGTAAGIAAAGGHSGGDGPHELRDVRTVTDRKDVRGPLDLVSAGFGQEGRDAVWRVRTRGHWTADDLAGAPDRRLCLFLRHGTAPVPDASVCVVRHRGSKPFALRYSSLDRKGHASHGRLVAAVISRSDKRSFSARIAPAALGLSAGERYRWRVESAWSEYRVCDGAAACTDDAPDTGAVAMRLEAVRPVTCARAGAHFVTNGPRSHRVVALTFDDGPGPYTPRVLGVLERRHVPATFFLIGRQVAAGARYTRRALEDGDVVGDHTWSHADVAGGGSAARSQIVSTRDAIRRHDGFDPCLFRAPGGAVSGTLISEAWGLGFKTIQWDVDPRDWSRPGSSAIYARVTSAVRPGSIVVLHDGGGPRDQTVAALPRIIDYLRARGYRFATVPGLLGLRLVYGRG